MTPQEFADAVAALEARRAQIANAHAETIPIAEAAAQLGLDLPPDEILAEIEKQRAGARQAEQEATTARGQRRQKLAVVAVLGITALTGMTALGSLLSPRSAAPSEVATAITMPAVAAPVVAPRPHFDPSRVPVADKLADGTAVVRTLAEVPENHPVMVRFKDLNTVLQIPGTEQYQNQLSEISTWSAVRRGGAFYLNGWVGAPVSPGVRKLGGVVVYNRRISPAGIAVGPNPKPVLLRLDAPLQATTDSTYVYEDGARWSSSDGNWQRLVLSQVPADFPAVESP